jgi:hypothetical protein
MNMSMQRDAQEISDNLLNRLDYDQDIYRYLEKLHMSHFYILSQTTAAE